MSWNKIVIEPIIPLWLILLLFSLGGLAVLLQYGLIQRRLARYKALTIALLRLGAISLLLSFLLNPSSVERKEYHLPHSLAILFDTSPSMGLPGQGGKGSRLDEARGLLLNGSNPLLNSITERFDVSLYALGESLRPLKEEELSQVKVGEKRADLTQAMKGARGKHSSVILLSDGNLKWDGHETGNPSLLILPLGDRKGYRDILIKSVKAPALAFRGREVRIDVTLRSYGFKGVTLPLVLKEGGKLLTAMDIRFNENPDEITIPLSFTPERVGQHNLSISIPSQSGESVVSNNHHDLSIKVAKDKIRILMVSGSPSPNYRFMRTALKNDPSIDLLSFVILRTPSDILNVPIQEQSLIPFPVETLFSRELHHFDLLIFDNLPSHLYISPKYYERIREFIKEGGGLAMIGGPHLMDGGRYIGTPLGEMLPVKMTGKEEYRRNDPPGVRLSREGMIHPITQLSPDENENQNLWREMPALDGINLLEPKTFKHVLLESADGGSRPILLADSYGKGCILILATDSSWKWYMGMVSRGQGNWAYLRFIERMVRWVTRDPSLSPVQITLPETSVEAGQESEFRIKVKDGSATSHLKGKVLLYIFDSDGVKIESRLKASDRSGEYLGSFTPKMGGIYRIKVEFPAGVQEEFMVVGRHTEDMDVAPNPEKLKMISTSAGGKVLTRDGDLLREINSYGDRGQRSFIEERRFPLWSMPYTFVMILTLFGAEWYLRRRWGLI